MLTPTMIDWVTAHLKIPGMPEIAGGRTLSLSQDGNVERDTAHWLAVAGSFVDTMRIRTFPHHEHGTLLSVSGCPPKYLQGHNIAGTTKLFPLMKKIYDTMRSHHPDLGLPPRPDELEFDIRRLDITRQFYAITETDDDKRAFLLPQDIIDHYERSARTRHGKGVFSKQTLYFNRPNTRYWKAKMYAKGPELDAHPIKDLGLKNSHGREIRELAELIIRCEIQLNDKTLNDIDAPDFVDCEPLFDKFWQRVEVTGMNTIEKTEQQVMQLPTQYRCTFYDWQNGVDLKAIMNRQTFYRHRRFIMKALDLDIAIPKKRKGKNALAITDARAFRLAPVEPPQWLQEISFDPDAQRDSGFLRG